MPTVATPREIAAEFDMIARLSPLGADVNAAGAWVVRNLPAARGAALDIGCGVGDVSRLIAPRFTHTDAIDLSAGMIAEAQSRTPPGTALTFMEADMFEWLAARPAHYDCIVSVATLHHVDFSLALIAMARSLTAGGRLLVIDLVDRSAPRYLFMNAIAATVGATRELVALLRRRSSLRLRRAYRQHAARERYLTLSEVRQVSNVLLPTSMVSSTLFWRYRLIWEKPST
jgi:trans-aconitate methyltransferase